ncbi:MAG: outer membrane protein transport protein [Myxococcota bacterium]|nr:outer membrane protein transport protein [Myxococcota bacterium]MDW8362178.1 outer membrane protein transport protein [Myxococcales bacterium]
MRPSASGVRVPSAVVALCFAGSSLAAAQHEDRHGLGARAMGLAGAMAARAGSFAALYHGPAGLAPVPGERAALLEASVETFVAHPFVRVESLRGEPLRTAAPARSTFALLFGVRADLSRALGVRGLGAGFSLYQPGDALARWSNHPDDQLQWLHLTDRTHRIGAMAGLGWRPLRWLAVGAAARILFDIETLTVARVTDAEPQTDPTTGESYVDVTAQLGERVRAYGRLAPVLSVLVEPTEGLTLAARYRGSSEVEDWGWTRVEQVPAIGTLGFVHRFSHHVEPDQLTVGVALEPAPRWSLGAEVAWTDWSNGRSAEHRRYPGHFGDTIDPAVGIEWEASAAVAMRAGYRFVRRTFDPFGGPANLLDSDEHALTVGAGVELGAPGGARSGRWSIDVALRVAWLPGDTERKDWRRFASDEELELNPGRDGYRWSGWLASGALGVRARW